MRNVYTPRQIDASSYLKSVSKSVIAFVSPRQVGVPFWRTDLHRNSWRVLFTHAWVSVARNLLSMRPASRSYRPASSWSPPGSHSPGGGGGGGGGRLSIFRRGTTRFGMAFARREDRLVWTPDGQSPSCSCWWGGTGFWPGIWLGAFLANVTHENQSWLRSPSLRGNTLEAVTAVGCCGRWSALTSFPSNEFKPTLGLIVYWRLSQHPRQATIGATSLCLGGVQPWRRLCVAWFDVVAR